VKLQAPLPWFGYDIHVMATIERFWAKVSKQPSGCWLWTGSKRSKGYGAFCYAKNGEVVQGRAHRFSWELHNGEIPDGLCVLHKCDVPSCVNPDHLWLGTKAENNRDMVAKGRRVVGGTYGGMYPRGESHPNCRYEDAVIRDIRKRHACGGTYSGIARALNMSVPYVRKIVLGLVRKEVGNG
jgi:hypothetical protein